MVQEKIWLSLAHMGGKEQDFINEAFITNWVVPLGPNVNGFEADLEAFLTADSGIRESVQQAERGCEGSDSPTNASAHLQTSASADSQITKSPNHQITNVTPHVVALSAGTAALHLALVQLGVGPGDEVICQSFTFAASANPIVYQGAQPVYVDSEKETWNMCPVALEEAIKDRIAKTGKAPKAIIPVHLYGMPSKMDEICAIASKYGIPVVEDAAEALGSSFQHQACGTFGEFGVLSFNGNKIITTSGGGALVCRTEEEKKKTMFLATQARDNAPHYQHTQIGYNYRMSNICAGIGRGQMLVLDEHVARRRAINAWYREALKDIAGISFQTEPDANFFSNYWLTSIVVDPALTNGKTREDLRLAMEKANIETRPLWKPMHMQPVFESAPYYGSNIAEDLFDKGLCLPSHPMLTEADLERIVAVVKETLC